MKRIARLLAIFMLFLPFIALDHRPVMAHVEMVQGDIRILAGWTNEPPIVGELNEIVLIISRVSDGQPINNALSQVAVTVNKGTESKSLQFQPTEESGMYTAEILPTEPGQYAVVMNGTIAGQAIDAQTEIEDVESTARFTFPPASAGSNEIPQQVIEQLQTVITGLTAQIDEANLVAEDARNASRSATESAEELKLAADRAYLFGMIGIGVGAAGIAIAVVALSRKDVVAVSHGQKL
ncbi:MAG TPA: hypothetical protein VFZ67_03340 [Nitrososphaera sp.]|jgi:hypothetical protein